MWWNWVAVMAIVVAALLPGAVQAAAAADEYVIMLDESVADPDAVASCRGDTG